MAHSIIHTAMTSDTITLKLPQSVANTMPELAQRLTDHMHGLLERNTEDTLTAMEQAELSALVEMAEFAQIIAMTVQGNPKS